MDAEEFLHIVVTDSSVIINFHHTSHLGLLNALPRLRFVIPEEVIAEITDPTQAQILSQLVEEGTFEKVSLKSAEELTYFADLSSRLGLGESACLAIAQSRGWLIACDEKRIFLREARHRIGDGRLINTPGVYVLLIRAGLLTVDEADQAKAVLEQHRYRIALASFRELI